MEGVAMVIRPTLRTATTTHLLMALLVPGEEAAWVEFDQRYRPVLIGFLFQLGVRDDDVHDVAQQTLLEFCRAYREGKYDRGKGRLGSWLIGIAQRQAASAARKRLRHHEQTLTAQESISDPARLTQLWERQHEQAIYQRAWEVLCSSSQFQDSTLRAFELTTLREVPPDEVARVCEMKIGDVYTAKSRVSRRLRELAADIAALYEEVP
jgi:DNA-directed RNA polymerase specialized sigma24 family protein